MKRYRLKKDSPTFNAGHECWVDDDDCLRTEILEGNRPSNPSVAYKTTIMAHLCSILDAFPNILTDWFEEIPEEPKTVYDLGIGDDAWFIEDGGIKKYVEMDEIELNLLRDKAEVGDLFLTKEEAEKELAWRRARTILKRDTKGFKPNWADSTQCKWSVKYDESLFKLRLDIWRSQNHGGIHFATHHDAEASIKAHEKEWLCYLGVEE